MRKFKTSQEEFWNGDFGDEYIERNKSHDLLAANLNLFSDVFSKTNKIQTVLELGCNVGMNIRAIKLLLPNAEVAGVEINKKASLEASSIHGMKVYNESLLEFDPQTKYEFVFSKGVLIHISPDELDSVYRKMADASSRYVMIAEYYNPVPISIDYRGHKDRLFKRDFAGEFLDRYPGYKLIDYKFHYKKSPNFSQDDITWFLMEKV